MSLIDDDYLELLNTAPPLPLHETLILLYLAARSAINTSVSRQVGRKQACTFCAMGRMGERRNLTSVEIATQLFAGNRFVRESEGRLPEITNPTAVLAAARSFTDFDRFRMSHNRVTISTVGIKPDNFRRIAESRCAMAWSLHAAVVEVRKRLVPTTKYSIEELRRGVVDAVRLYESKSKRKVMIEYVLIAGVNDTDECQRALLEFAQ